jgi:hypothetical protein
LLFLALISFSTEDSFPHVFTPSWCAVPLHCSRSAPHNPIFSCLNCAGLPPFPVPGLSSLWTDCVLLLGRGWLVLVRGGDACRAVGGGLQSGAALIDVRLDVGPLPSRSSSLTLAGCRLVGWVGFLSDQWGGERVVGGVLVPCYPALTLAPTCEAK